MSTGNRCEVVDATVDHEYGPDSDKPREFQIVLKWNTRDFQIARFVLGNSGMELVHLNDAYGKEMELRGTDIGQSLMEPDKP